MGKNAEVCKPQTWQVAVPDLMCVHNTTSKLLWTWTKPAPALSDKNRQSLWPSTFDFGPGTDVLTTGAV